MKSVFEDLARCPLVPYIREADVAARYPQQFGKRRLLDYWFIYVRDGGFRLYVEEEEYRLQEGDCCLVQPGDLHWFEDAERATVAFAHFDLFYNPRRQDSFPTRPGQAMLGDYDGLMQPRLNDYDDMRVPVRLELPDAASFRDVFLQAIALWMKQTPFSLLEAEQRAAAAMLTLLKCCGKNVRPPVGPGQLNWVASYCSLRLSGRLTVEQLARQAKLSPSRFNAIFRQTFGQTPYQYVLSLRVRHARELLAESSHSLTEIANLCGFTDIHHFSKTFKKSTGMTPGSYRSKHRG